MDNVDEIKKRFERIGFPRAGASLSDEDVAGLEKKIPPSFIWILDSYGCGDLFDGLFRFCNPNKLRAVLALVFKADTDFSHQDCHVLGFSAFGELRAWSERYGVLDIDLPAGRVTCAALAPTEFKKFGITTMPKLSFTDDSLVRSMIPFDQEDVDYQDFSGKPMYRACVKSHGALEADECYGFFPALAISGEGSKFHSVDNIRRVKAMEHFALLAQVAPFTLVKIGPRGFEPIRVIG